MNVTFEADTDRKLVVVQVLGELCPVETKIHFARLEMFLHEYQLFNILMDLRGSTLKEEERNMSRAMDVVTFYSFFEGQGPVKIAAVLPDDEGRLQHGRHIESAATIRGIDYRTFVDINEAMAWLK